MRSKLLLYTLLALPFSLFANEDDADVDMTELEGISVQAKQQGLTRLSGAENGLKLDQSELFKAACCNLGESFVNNASTDVNYSDAATGAKQVKLMGLSGTYVQLLSENLPAFRGVASPFALDYVPGTFMKSLMVSKGASSVKNGYESVTGQINVDYLKPDDEEQININLYGDSHSRLELNADANSHFGEKLSTLYMVHYEDAFHHMDNNNDGFLDAPMKKNLNFQNRWKYKTRKDILQTGLGMVREQRTNGQTHDAVMHGHERYNIGIGSDHYNFYLKNGVFLNQQRNESVAVMASADWHNIEADYGHKHYDAEQQNLYAQVMYETTLHKFHNISVGANFSRDNIDQFSNVESLNANGVLDEDENVVGGYAQYTYTLGGKFTGMAGFRADHSSDYGTFFTPRCHLKYSPASFLTIRASAGKGYRTPHALAENNNLLASGRSMRIDKLDQEEAWNTGISTSWYIPLFGKTLSLNAEYFYTTFQKQMVVDYEADSSLIYIHNLAGDSYSHTLQVDASYPLFRGMTVTAAYRMNDVKCTYNDHLRTKPLTNRYKALFTASYKTPLELWQFDVNCQINGGGRLPDAYTLANGIPSWRNTYHSFTLLSAQVTREFRHFSVYVGGENLTNFKQKTPIHGADNPFGTDFEPTLVWGPVSGVMAYAGVRIKL